LASQAFITDDFMLETAFARDLYHQFAEQMPIIDYHCHLPPSEIAKDKRWENITQVWLHGDHYKWRAMRSNGVDERFCTGDAPDREKFQKFAETMPYLLRNPLYHWSHLELARYFGIGDILLSPETAGEIWDRTSERLAHPDMSARELMKRSNVRLVCTTDDPIDSLEYHNAILKDENFSIKVLPTWRPDKAMAVDDPPLFGAWVARLAEVADMEIGSWSSLMAALRLRHDLFHTAGCRLSDHGVTTVYADTCTNAEAEAILRKAFKGVVPSDGEIRRFKSTMMYEFGLMDAEKNWTQQIHYAALRNSNTRMFEQIGPDTGFDSIGDWPIAQGLSSLLDRLASSGSLPRTILYTLNPRDNELLASMLGCFQDGKTPGKIQLGSGWWFNDQKDGMERQMEVLSQMGLLSRFVGMLTDSRSFLSYTRHEYFRRILCNILGNDIKKGLIPRDMALVGRMVKDICYNNAAAYFGFDLD